MNSIAKNLPTETLESWQEQLQNAIRTPEALAEAVGLALPDLAFSNEADKEFPLLVPHAFAARIRRGDPQDPLLLQVLATPQEMQATPGYSEDPVAEVSRYGGTPGVLQKYQSRALMVVTGQCAVNCRYCFRRHYPYADNAHSSSERQSAINRLLNDDSIRELILSGGDPLLLPDTQIAAISTQLSAAGRGVTLRIHTRLPIVIPARVTDTLIAALQRPNMPVVIVLHSNHPQEIDAATASAITRLRDAGFTVLNQSVLLAKINDNAETLAQLSDRLFQAGALPYYMHILDKVSGAAHFDIALARARALAGELAAIRPGYLVPRLMMELAGASSKREFAPSYPEDAETTRAFIDDRLHPY